MDWSILHVILLTPCDDRNGTTSDGRFRGEVGAMEAKSIVQSCSRDEVW
eukprot:CAMPEP_0206140742 /NCGR_PEP_ID=MMETSP1473-20131121/10523_1 /ASSEMBLY_ACC=CAM_ASM_001109 /TAXON_ID=1461547 /ORGANISM="Stichococcus sp, Strain RCC1054" /LENGTH=48 /DNA_ID= /DNA_START= /DNA_END= /DNA_ORIENTATION=